MASVEELKTRKSPGKEYRRRTQANSTRSVIGKIGTYLVLSLLGVSMLIPVLWMLSTSLKASSALFTGTPEWIPSPALWHNYIDSWNAQPFALFYMNSIYVGAMVTFGQVLTSSMAAYAFARLSFPGRDKIFLGYLATMMIPGSVTMIPTYILIRKLNLLDTYTALILPGFFSAFGTFMLRQFFMSLPRELEEAAKIDGCSLFGIFWRISLPLSKPALASLTTFTFMGSWNNFTWPMVVTNSTAMKTLPLGLDAFQGVFTTQWALLMAASLVALVPVILVFVFGQRYFVEGIQLGAVKG